MAAGNLPRFGDGYGVAGTWHIQADALHGFLEELAIFALGDRFRTGTDQSDMVLFRDPCTIEFHRAIERRLAAQGRQQRIRSFPGDYFFNDSRVIGSM